MTAIAMTADQMTRAHRVARDIGWEIRAARMAAGESQREAALAVGTWQSAVGNIERGDSVNVKLGNVVKLLDRYDLAIQIVPKAGVSK